MAKAAAKTGVSPTALIAIEQYFPEKQRIIEDDLAYRILPFSARALVWLVRPSWIRSWLIRETEKNSPGIWGGIMCRKRYIDEKLADSSNQIEAVVNLGAGFDTRAYRLPALYDIPVWEVDQSENIKAKLHRLDGARNYQVEVLPDQSASNYLQKIIAGKIPVPFSHYFYLDISFSFSRRQFRIRNF